jgi:hypothetical protein
MKIKIQERILGLALLLWTPLAAQAQLTYVTNNGAITITGYTKRLKMGTRGHLAHLLYLHDHERGHIPNQLIGPVGL